MLLSSRGKPYVCWRCVTCRTAAFTTLLASQHRRFNQTLAGASKLEAETGPLGHHNVPANNGNYQVKANTSRVPASSNRPKPSIRDELRAWALSDQAPEVTTRPLDVSLSARVNNRLTRTQGDSSSLDEGGSEHVGDVLGFSQDEEVGIAGTSDRQVGDLVELATPASRWGTLAIYLGFFSGRHHFYSHNSKWLMSAGFPAVFSVAKFASEEELASVLRSIPMGLSVEEYQHMQKQNQGPSRNDGAELLKKMRDFRLESELIHQNNIVTLDSARELLAHDTEVRHLSLFEITDILLPKARNDDGSFPASALYSVLSVLGREDIAFRALSPSRDCHRQDYMFEIVPKATVQSIKRAVAAVRQYTLLITNSRGIMQEKHAKANALNAFVAKARAVVTQSRVHRGWTRHGTLEPSQGFELDEPGWKNSNMDIINFLQWWASFDIFTTSSHYHSYGSTILRATGLYEDAPLDQRTAWTFLQEIGHIKSGEIPSRFRIRLPGTTFGKGGGITRKPLPDVAILDSQQADIAADRRIEINRMVFCIDHPDTVIIDDGISLERTDKEDQFWIHVHVADPASRIRTKSELAGFLELVPENIYLPGHFEAMLPSQMGKDLRDPESRSLLQELSLHPGSLTLTFSAKVNAAGDILDYDIKPGKLTKVSYLDPGAVSKFCDEPKGMAVPDIKLSVGEAYGEETYAEPRSMVTPEQLDKPIQDDLLTLYKLSQALKVKRLAKGAWPMFPPRPSVSVQFDPKMRAAANNASTSGTETPSVDIHSDDSPPCKTMRIPADPYINVGYQPSEGCSVVSNTMVLAGQVAARWCSDRGIPLPFRRDTASATNYDKALTYVKEQVYPLLLKGIDPGREHRALLSALIGGTELSTSSGPYFILGIDEYAKVTSPLRRFGDLLAHWQIHAAIGHEFRTGEKVNPSNVNDIVPYPEESLARTLILLQMREKMIRAMARSSRDWILTALVRAWRANDGSIPDKMRFTVTTRGTSGLLGQLDYFDLPASMDAVQIDGKVLIQDISVGDQLEVELADINVYDGIITVKALEYLGRTKDSPPMPSFDARPLLTAGAQEHGFGIFPASHKTPPSTAS